MELLAIVDQASQAVKLALEKPHGRSRRRACHSVKRVVKAKLPEKSRSSQRCFAAQDKILNAMFSPEVLKANIKDQTSRRLPTSFFRGPVKESDVEQESYDVQDYIGCQFEVCSRKGHQFFEQYAWDNCPSSRAFDAYSLDSSPSEHNRPYQFEENSPSPANSFTTETAQYTAPFHKHQDISSSSGQSDIFDDFYGVARSYPSTCAQSFTVEAPQNFEFDNITDQILEYAPNGEAEWQPQGQIFQFEDNTNWNPLPEFSHAFGNVYS